MKIAANAEKQVPVVGFFGWRLVKQNHEEET